MSLNANWELRVRERVYKDIASFPREARERITAVIESLSDNPYAGDIEKMKGEERAWRRRIGNYRVRYEIIPGQKIVYVFRVERRATNTY